MTRTGMTPERARRRSRGWFITALVALVVYVPLEWVKLPAGPLGGVAMYAAVMSAHWRGWAIGHTAPTSASVAEMK